MKISILACVLALSAAVLPAFAADTSDTAKWLGTWKLDPSRSHLTGDTFAYSKLPDGQMHFSNGSAVKYDFAIDGKPYASNLDRTVVWTASGDNVWNSVTSAHGAELYQTRTELASDNKSLTQTTTGTKPDGSPFKTISVYHRIAGYRGLVGEWQSIKVDLPAPDTFVISMPAPDTYRWSIPSYKEFVQGPANGTDLPITGPTIPSGITLSCKILSPSRLFYVIKAKGQPLAYQTQIFAPDGKSFTEVDWDAGKPTEKLTAVYIRQ